jgi:OOP family OmpA-OmpF porin
MGIYYRQRPGTAKRPEGRIRGSARGLNKESDIMLRKLLAGIVISGLSLAGTATAAEKPGQWYIAPMASVIWVDRDRLTDDEIGAALAIGRAFNGGFNVELNAFGYQLDGINETDYWGVGLDLMQVFYRGSRISPYLSAGAGWNVKNRTFGNDEKNEYLNAAFGFLTDLSANGSVALRTELRYRQDREDSNTINDLVLNVGLQIPFGSPYSQPVAAAAPPPPPPPPPPDSDGDGVPDSRDRCPDTPPGVAVDEHGCPLDSDGDGVPDYLDKCPDTPSGTRVDSRGCPIEDVIRLEGITFEFNSDRIAADERGTLNEAVGILKRYPEIRVEVAGHTDSVGAAAYNRDLSERRARSVMEYLVSAGIAADRMTARGYGQEAPIADNSSDEGRAMNRRVELRILD